MGLGAGLYMYDVVVKKYAFAISSNDGFLFYRASGISLYICCLSVCLPSVKSRCSVTTTRLGSEVVEVKVA